MGCAKLLTLSHLCIWWWSVLIVFKNGKEVVGCISKGVYFFLYQFIILKNSDLIFLQCYLNVVDRVLGGVDCHCPSVDLLNFVAMRLRHLLYFAEGKINKRKKKNSQPQYGLCVRWSRSLAGGSWSHFGSHMWPYPWYTLRFLYTPLKGLSQGSP